MAAKVGEIILLILNYCALEFSGILYCIVGIVKPAEGTVSQDFRNLQFYSLK